MLLVCIMYVHQRVIVHFIELSRNIFVCMYNVCILAENLKINYMKEIIKNLEQQIIELNKQDELLGAQGIEFNSLRRANVRACMLDIKNVIETLKRQ